jgi:hypothetical protein
MRRRYLNAEIAYLRAGLRAPASDWERAVRAVRGAGDALTAVPEVLGEPTDAEFWSRPGRKAALKVG